MEVLTVAIMIIFRAHAETKADKHLRIIDAVIFRAILAITIEISGIITIANATELSYLDEIQDKTSGGATIRIVHVQGKIIDTAMPAAMIATRISIENEISATWPNRPDITEDILRATLKDIHIRIRTRHTVNRLWRNIADSQAMISATTKMRSAGEFISETLDRTLHLRGSLVVRSLSSLIMTASQTSSRVFNLYRLQGPRPQTISDVTRPAMTKFKVKTLSMATIARK